MSTSNKWIVPAVVVGGVAGWLLLRKKITKIGDIISKPTAYRDKTVTVVGTVSYDELLYHVQDNTGAILITPPLNPANYIGKGVRITGVVILYSLVPFQIYIEIGSIELT